MQGDSSFIKRFKIDFILLGVLACVCLGYVVDAHPIRISRSDTPGAASMPQQLGQSNILLILPDTTQTAESYPEMDFSFAMPCRKSSARFRLRSRAKFSRPKTWRKRVSSSYRRMLPNK